MMSYSRELLKGSTDSLLLYLICNQPMYGYQIIKELKKRSNGYFRFKEGTLYPALHRLERAGFIEGEWKKLPNGQARRYYFIKSKGEQVLYERLGIWHSFSDAINAIIQPDVG